MTKEHTQEDIKLKRYLMNVGIDNLPAQVALMHAVAEERKRQDNKFGPSPRNMHSGVWLAVLMEELGEVSRAILESDSTNYKEELIQVAASAIAALEDYQLGTQALSFEDVGCGIKYKREQEEENNARVSN